MHTVQIMYFSMDRACSGWTLFLEWSGLRFGLSCSLRILLLPESILLVGGSIDVMLLSRCLPDSMAFGFAAQLRSSTLLQVSLRSHRQQTPASFFSRAAISTRLCESDRSHGV